NKNYFPHKEAKEAGYRNRLAYGLNHMAGLHWKVIEDNAILFRVRAIHNRTYYLHIPPGRGRNFASLHKNPERAVWELSALYRRTLLVEDGVNYFIEAGPAFLKGNGSGWPFHTPGPDITRRRENNWVSAAQLSLGVERVYRSNLLLAFTLSYTRGFNNMYSFMIFTDNLFTYDHLISCRGSYLSANLVVGIPLIRHSAHKERPSIKSPRYVYEVSPEW
ncbi:MAG: hypothetical protein ACK4ND_18795, partial [Cytophagaceae bacterium]